MTFILQGILLVYDITNGWSFDGIDRWIREIDEVIPFKLFAVDKYRKCVGRGPTLCLFASRPEKDNCPIVHLRMRKVE